MSEPFIAEVRMWGCNFAPRGWAFCEGQLLPISQNTALFSLIGTTYGGDGRTTVGLPNLTDRAPMHAGAGPGLTRRLLGERGGSNEVTLSEAQLPSHDHIVRGVAQQGDKASPDESLFMGQDGGGRQEKISYLASGVQTNAALAPETIGSNGGGQPHENRQPFLGMKFCIALEGVYPTRS